MDVDYFNSATESSQFDLMTMMMGMEKPPLDQPLAISPAGSSLPFNGHHHDIFTPISSLTSCYYSPAAEPQPVECSALPSVAAMREMIFHVAAMQPIHIDPESVRPPKRRNVRISKDPQSVAARHRRERISERIRILQQLVPGGTKMDTASMLDEAIHYMKFLKGQVQALERAAAANRPGCASGAPAAAGAGWFSGLSYAGFDRRCDQAWEHGFPVNTTSSSSDAN